MVGTILITGANGSLAIEAARYLLTNAPEHTLVLTVRDASDEDPNTKALRDVLAQHPPQQTRASVRQLDLSRLASVHEFAQDIAGEVSRGDLPPLVSIVCNAYFWNLSRPLERTADGFEKTVQVTHLAHAALVLRLLGSFHPQEAGRIVHFSSDAIFPGQNGLERIPPAIPDDLEVLARPPPDEKNDPWAYGFLRYANTKLAVVMWIHALNRRLENDTTLKHITAVAIHPGSLSDSRALRVNTPFMIQCLSRVIVRPLRPLIRLVDPTVRTSADAGKDVARLAINEARPNERGYFTLLEKCESSPESLDEDKQEEVWRRSSQWVGLAARDTALEQL